MVVKNALMAPTRFVGTYPDAGQYSVRLRTVGQSGEASAEIVQTVSIIAGGTPPDSPIYR